MASIQAQKRLTREYKAIVKNPPQYIIAKPNEKNLLEWHYVITGPPDTVYSGGQYHGTLVFQADYPFKPPAIRMTTPSGRFRTNSRLCLSMSDYHPDTWNPAWSVSTILTGLLSFMTGTEETTGSIATTDGVKIKMAAESRAWNNSKDLKFIELFPELVIENEKIIANQRLKESIHENVLRDKSVTRDKEEILVSNLDNIKDPEDRLRAEEMLKLNDELQKIKNNYKESKDGKPNIFMNLAFIILLVVIASAVYLLVTKHE